MSKEVKFYLALGLIGVLLALGCFFYITMELTIYSNITEKLEKVISHERALAMCLCLAPILPLFIYAKNNRP
tara:strand:+ start:1363 stop:1578 length:216 start_codon:yes stop_codon:yes gene_type:complete